MSTASTSKPHIAHELLARAHSPDSAARIFNDKILKKPLLLRPSETPQAVVNARTQRQQERQHRRDLWRRSNKPRPLSAKQKRKLGVYELQPEEKKYEIYVGLHALWCDYIRGVLGLREGKQTSVQVEKAGPILTGADYHGAEMEVVGSRCVGRVGIKGIVVKDTKFTFELITRKNELKTVPKEHTIFRFQVPLIQEAAKASEQEEQDKRPLVFEIHGEQFQNRAPDRANKKFKMHITDDL